MNTPDRDLTRALSLVASDVLRLCNALSAASLYDDSAALQQYRELVLGGMEQLVRPLLLRRGITYGREQAPDAAHRPL